MCDILLDLARPKVSLFGDKVGLVFFFLFFFFNWLFSFLPERFLLLTKQTTNDSLLPVRQRTGSTRC